MGASNLMHGTYRTIIQSFRLKFYRDTHRTEPKHAGLNTPEGTAPSRQSSTSLIEHVGQQSAHPEQKDSL